MKNDGFYTLTESIFIFFGVIGALIYQFLKWIMPRTYEIFFKHFKDVITKDVNEELKEIKDMLQGYKAKKHALEGENKSLKQAIKEAETLEELKDIVSDDCG